MSSVDEESGGTPRAGFLKSAKTSFSRAEDSVKGRFLLQKSKSSGSWGIPSVPESGIASVCDVAAGADTLRFDTEASRLFAGDADTDAEDVFLPTDASSEFAKVLTFRGDSLTRVGSKASVERQVGIRPHSVEDLLGRTMPSALRQPRRSKSFPEEVAVGMGTSVLCDGETGRLYWGSGNGEDLRIKGQWRYGDTLRLNIDSHYNDEEHGDRTIGGEVKEYYLASVATPLAKECSGEETEVTREGSRSGAAVVGKCVSLDIRTAARCASGLETTRALLPGVTDYVADPWWLTEATRRTTVQGAFPRKKLATSNANHRTCAHKLEIELKDNKIRRAKAIDASNAMHVSLCRPNQASALQKSEEPAVPTPLEMARVGKEAENMANCVGTELPPVSSHGERTDSALPSRGVVSPPCMRESYLNKIVGHLETHSTSQKAGALPVVDRVEATSAATIICPGALGDALCLEKNDSSEDMHLKEIKSFRLTDLGEGLLEDNCDDSDGDVHETESIKLGNTDLESAKFSSIKSFKLCDVTEDYDSQEIHSYPLNELDNESDIDDLSEVGEDDASNELNKLAIGVKNTPHILRKELKSFKQRNLKTDIGFDDDGNNLLCRNASDQYPRVLRPQVRPGKLCSHPIDTADDNWDSELEVIVMQPVVEICTPSWHTKLFLPVVAFAGALIVGLSGLDKA